MKNFKLKIVSVIFAVFFLVSTAPGTVFGYFITLDEFTGDDSQIILEVTGDGTSSIMFDLQVQRPAFADLGGFWFDFNTYPTMALTVTGADVTASIFSMDGVSNVGSPNNNLGGNGNIYRNGWDAGIAIGDQGIGGETQIYSTMFTVSSSNSEILNLGTRFGARLQSVGDFENNRGGSSKLVGFYSSNPNPPAPVPEPATMLLLGTGLAGLAGVRFIRKKKQ